MKACAAAGRLGLGVSSFEFWIVVSRLWVVGCGLWVVGCGLWVVGCGLWLWVVKGTSELRNLGVECGQTCATRTNDEHLWHYARGLDACFTPAAPIAASFALAANAEEEGGWGVQVMRRHSNDGRVRD